MAEKERMESVKDRDINNDGIPDIWVDPKTHQLTFKDPHTKEIYDKYLTTTDNGRTLVLSTPAILVDICLALEKMNELLEKIASK